MCKEVTDFFVNGAKGIWKALFSPVGNGVKEVEKNYIHLDQTLSDLEAASHIEDFGSKTLKSDKTEC